MKNLIKSSFIAVFAVAIAFISTPVKADGHENFDITVIHKINGTALGLDKDLLVDIYVILDGEELAVLSNIPFGTKYETSLPAGSYEIVVTLAGDSAPVMELGPVDIPDDADVKITATLGAGKKPTLRAVIR